jgi:ribosome-associated translation inhibitor RaiA
MEKNINYSGVDKLDTFEEATLKKLSEKHYEKVLRDLNKYQDINLESELKINIKRINTEGKQKNYLISANIKSNAKNFNAEESDWDLSKAIHKLFENLGNQVHHKLKLK